MDTAAYIQAFGVLLLIIALLCALPRILRRFGYGGGGTVGMLRAARLENSFTIDMKHRLVSLVYEDMRYTLLLSAHQPVLLHKEIVADAD